MATEHVLSDKLKVVVYYGGFMRGRCYDFIDTSDPTHQRTRTLTEEGLLRVIRAEEAKSR